MTSVPFSWAPKLHFYIAPFVILRTVFGQAFIPFDTLHTYIVFHTRYLFYTGANACLATIFPFIEGPLLMLVGGTSTAV